MEERCRGGFVFSCLCLFIFCTYPTIVRAGIPVNSRSRHSRERLSRLLEDVPKPRGTVDRITMTPTMKMKGRLLSRTGYFLEILLNGTVQATLNNSSIYTVLEIQSYSSKLKRFLGFYSNHFLAYEVKGKRKGKFTGEPMSRSNRQSHNSLFEEHMEENSYTTYRAFAFTNNLNGTGYLAIKENGKFRRVERSKPGMHASQFTFLARHEERQV